MVLILTKDTSESALIKILAEKVLESARKNTKYGQKEIET